MKAQLSFIHALSSLHPGTGQGAGVIDLPIAREKATGLPFLPGSSLKGAIATRGFNQRDEEKLRISKQIFGTRELSDNENAASLAQFSDQRLLLLPVRSLAGTFAWVTSPFVLHRLLRDLKETQAIMPDVEGVPRIESASQCSISDNEKESVLTLTIGDEEKICLEDLDLTATKSKQVRIWSNWIAAQVFPDEKDWQKMLQQRFCLVHDDVLSFLLDTATEITTRIRLNPDTKTVVEGALWYEEALPPETILSGVVLATPTRNGLPVANIFKELSALTAETIQLGGNATVGRGLCRVRLIGKGE